LDSTYNPFSPFPFQKNWRQPRKPAGYQPILGLAVGDQTWVLTTPEIAAGGEILACTEPYFFAQKRGEAVRKETVTCPQLTGVQTAENISYWGHYPVVDMEFETSAPVSVGLRAWSPFIPGDIPASNIPAAVFEVYLRNFTGQAQEGVLAMNYPGPSPEEARSIEFTRQEIHEDFQGLLVSASKEVNYILGVIGKEQARFGSGFGSETWAKINTRLPQPVYRESLGARYYEDASSSAAVHFKLLPGESQVVRFLLAWYAPVWEGAQNNLDSLGDNVAQSYQERFKVVWGVNQWAGDVNYYTEMYAARFESAVDVARKMAEEHESLFGRIIAWQSEIYGDECLPVWLRDSLVNNLALIPEDSYWAQAKPPLGDWAYPEGVFALNESPRGCPDLSVTPCDWYGNYPIVYFFPELARTTLRAYQFHQKENGEIPIWLGKMGDLPDFVTPGYHWQVSLNSMCYIDLVYRLWRCTGDGTILKEFYESVKQANTFTMGLKKGPGGPISMPEEGGMEWFEHGEWAGMATHMGGLRLAELRMMAHMAECMGDLEYARRCQEWLADGSRAMEEEMWTGRYYLNFFEKETGKVSDDVMAYQLDGEWLVDFYGLGPVFRPERVKITLETIKETNIPLTPEVGAANFARPDGSPLPAGAKVAFYGQFAMFPPEVLILAMTYMYAGQQEYGLELARKHWENLVLKQRHPWDLPNLVRGDTGERIFGTDYYQNMMLWNLPAAMESKTLDIYAKKGNLIDRVIQAGK
jgi:uncharacterized protein (DUF608 family)